MLRHRLRARFGSPQIFKEHQRFKLFVKTIPLVSCCVNVFCCIAAGLCYRRAVKTLKTKQGASEEPSSKAISVKSSWSGPKGRARHGKIARLPGAVRTELNQRLQDGEPPCEILLWLNALPSVQQVLQKLFDGQAISEDNLSKCRHGGFMGWLQERSTVEAVSSLSSACAGMNEDKQEDMTSKLSIVLAARLAAELQRFDAMEDGEAKSSEWRNLVASFLFLQRADYYRMRVHEERNKEALQYERMRAEQAAAEPMSPEEKEDRINEIMGAGRFEAHWDNFNKKWVGPGAAMRYEEEEVTRQVRAEMERRYAVSDFAD
jgi:hypothetical protein